MKINVKTWRTVVAMAGVILGLVLVPGPRAWADQPIGVSYRIEYLEAKGIASPGETAGGDSQIAVTLLPGNMSLAKSYLAVVFPGCGRDQQVGGRPLFNLEEVIAGKVSPEYNRKWQKPGPRWYACPDRYVVVLAPGQNAQIKVGVDFLRCSGEGLSPRLRGKVFRIDERTAGQILQDGASATVLLGERQPDSEVIIDPYYRINARCEWSAGTYESIFGITRKFAPVKSYDESPDTIPVDVLSYRREMRLPGVFKDDGGAMLKRTLDNIYQRGSGLAGEPDCFTDDFKLGPVLQTGEPIGGAADLHGEDTSDLTLEALAAVTVSGRFSTKWTADHSLHPAWGFRVQATTILGTASTWVESDGSWSLSVPVGIPYTIYYRSFNGYYRPQNQSGNTYSWAHSFPGAAVATNIGHWYADTDGGTYNGLGELVDGAMWMWSRLYWDGGINPVPSSALTLWYPNTWYDCGDGSGNPWSCANTSGEIWLIATHGVQADVVTHEMSHQLNNKYWNNKRPAGSGGSHTLTGCYPLRLGMALREGFADFMPAWIGYPNRNVPAGGFGSGRWALDLDAESNSSPPNCSNGWENEVWVARTFWDLHDTRADGDDILWFIHKGAVPAIYLSNGIANDGDARDMRDYETIYRGAASAGHEGFITDIFEQNRM